MLNRVKAIRMRHTQGVQNQRIHHTKDHRIGADGDGQGQNSGDCECARFAQ